MLVAVRHPGGDAVDRQTGREVRGKRSARTERASSPDRALRRPVRALRSRSAGITYLLVSHSTRHRPPGGILVGRPFAAALGRAERTVDIGRIAAALRYQNDVDLHQLLVESGIALAVMATSRSRWAGWSPAGCSRHCGRSRPGRRRISEQSLHERLALTGPRDELRAAGGHDRRTARPAGGRV